MTDAPTLISVRATVTLQGLQVGDRARVDPADPYIAGLLAGQLLVPVEGDLVGGNDGAGQRSRAPAVAVAATA